MSWINVNLAKPKPQKEVLCYTANGEYYLGRVYEENGELVWRESTDGGLLYDELRVTHWKHRPAPPIMN